VTRPPISIVLITIFLVSVASAQQPQEQSDAYKARAMLLRVSVAVKADKGTALKKFTAGEDGFRDRHIPVLFYPERRYGRHRSDTWK